MTDLPRLAATSPMPHPSVERGRDEEPHVVVIIPLFKHSVLLSEAVQSVLDQVCSFPVVTLIVDDGCPFIETATVGLSLAAANSSVRYLRKSNGGLSSARNFGINYALREFPKLQALY